MKLLTLAVSAWVATNVPAADWPQFRGPQGNGVTDAATLRAALDRDDIAWHSGLPGRGLSSPLVIGDRVFVTCSSGLKQDRLHVVCFRVTDGAKLWERQFWATGRTMCHEKTSVAAPTPASDGERIFATFSSNDLVCLDLEGNLIWLRGLTRDYPNSSNSLGMSSSLVVVDGVVVAMVENQGDSFTVGLDAATGANRWRLSRPKVDNWTSPVLLPSAGGAGLVALQSSKGVTAVNPATGEVAWESLQDAATIPSAAVSGGVLYVPSGGMTALKLDAENQPPEQLWRVAQLSPGTASPVVLDDKVFTVNNASVLTCADAKDGKRLWQLRLKGPFSATPVAAGNVLYCVSEAGLLQAVDTSKPEGEIVSTLDLSETVLSTPAIAGDALYVRSDGKLWKLKGS